MYQLYTGDILDPSHELGDDAELQCKVDGLWFLLVFNPLDVEQLLPGLDGLHSVTAQLVPHLRSPAA